MEFYSGYDPFTKQVYVRAPRKAVHADVPEACTICRERGDEVLFANPCIGCACNIAVHASCWKQWGRDECMVCRAKFSSNLEQEMVDRLLSMYEQMVAMVNTRRYGVMPARGGVILSYQTFGALLAVYCTSIVVAASLLAALLVHAWVRG